MTNITQQVIDENLDRKNWIYGSIIGSVRWSPKRQRVSFTFVPDNGENHKLPIKISIVTSLWHPSLFENLPLYPGGTLRLKGIFWNDEFKMQSILPADLPLGENIKIGE